MFLQRGSWIPKNGIKSINDIFNSNESKSDYLNGTIAEQKTSSWQRFYPHEEQRYGYDLIRFAHDGANKKFEARKPVIVEFNIRDEVTFNKYSKYLKVILTRGQEDDISARNSLVSFRASLVDASKFSYEDFLQYKGEVLVDDQIKDSGISMVEDLQCAVYETKYSNYLDFTQAFNEGKVQPIYKTEDIVRELTQQIGEGNPGMNR